MGIFSKFQIKDIKSKILGGRAKQKGDLPAISVIPPTPSAKTDFAFPANNNQKARNIQGENNSGFRAITRQRSYSLPDCVDENSESQINSCSLDQKVDVDCKIYLKLPRNGRKKKKSRKKRAFSCPENLSDLGNVEKNHFDAMKTVDSCSSLSQNDDGPSLSDTSDSLSLSAQDISLKKVRLNDGESEEFLAEDDQHDEQFGGAPSYEYLSDVDSGQNNQQNVCSMDSSLSSFNSHNEADFTKKEQTSDELNEPGETTPLCAELNAKSEIFGESGSASLKERIRRRVRNSYRTTPETRWSLDLERLLAGGNQKFSEENEENHKWDGHSSDMPPISNGKNIVSTWSLDLDNKAKINCEVERAKSEICVGAAPSAKHKSKIGGEHVITNAKSLDLDLVSREDGGKNDITTSETMLRSTSLKRGINDCIGKFNGIVSKFSTWSLDIDMHRKRSLDGELNDSNRAQSELLLDEVDIAPVKSEKSLSYHTLLYDIDEASRYQIYQPTVYDIGDEGEANDRSDGSARPASGAKSGQYASSMKFISKQFGNLYENSKNLYKHRYAIIDAIKQREKELKAIADRQNASTVNKTEQIFKPKSAPRQRSQSYNNQRHKDNKPS